jgi:hypothetical protein
VKLLGLTIKVITCHLIILLFITTTFAYSSPKLELTSPVDGSTTNCAVHVIANATFSNDYPEGGISVLSGDCQDLDSCDYYTSRFCYEKTCSLDEMIGIEQGGPHTITVVAYQRYSSNTSVKTSFSVDCTPLSVSVTSPNGSTSRKFDITGNVTFKPIPPNSAGQLLVYLNEKLIDYKNCYSEICSYSYKQQRGFLYTLPPGGPYNLVLKASLNGGTASSKKVFFVDSIVPDHNQGPPDCPQK